MNRGYPHRRLDELACRMGQEAPSAAIIIAPQLHTADEESVDRFVDHCADAVAEMAPEFVFVGPDCSHREGPHGR